MAATSTVLWEDEQHLVEEVAPSHQSQTTTDSQHFTPLSEEELAAELERIEAEHAKMEADHAARNHDNQNPPTLDK